ncbi:MAG: CAP domain-containing protein [Lautropia sp.]|nr:CAP domain-containing protein [Lautropia sp.]
MVGAATGLVACAGSGGYSTPLDPALGDGNATSIRTEYQTLHGEPPEDARRGRLQLKEEPVLERAEAVLSKEEIMAGRFHALAEEVITKVNAVRAKARQCGDEPMEAAPPVRWNARVAYAALLESEWMLENNRFDHAWETGELVWDRFEMVGYRWSKADENIAAGFRTLDEAIEAWVDSPSHCKAMMRADIEEIGLAVVPGYPQSRYRSYWTMALGTPR